VWLYQRGCSVLTTSAGVMCIVNWILYSSMPSCISITLQLACDLAGGAVFVFDTFCASQILANTTFQFVSRVYAAGVSQNFARKYRIPIDQLTFDFEVMKVEKDIPVKPADGAYVWVSLFICFYGKPNFSNKCLQQYNAIQCFLFSGAHSTPLAFFVAFG